MNLLVTILDTDTGETRESKTPSNMFWWAEGNGSCDCNRALLFGEAVEMEQHMKVGIEEGYCLGARRFLAVDLRGDTEGRSLGQALREINRDYPDELLRKHNLA